MKIKADLMIIDNNAKYICERKLKVKPILNYYGCGEIPNDERQYTEIKASCPVCRAAGVRADLASGAREFKCCPICGINLDWRVFLKKEKKLRRKIELWRTQFKKHVKTLALL